MDHDEIFLTYYKIKQDKTLLETTYTRKEFFQLVKKALIIFLSIFWLRFHLLFQHIFQQEFLEID